MTASQSRTNLTGKKEVGRAMSNCIEKLVSRTFGRDASHWLDLVEASLSTSKYWQNIFKYCLAWDYIEFTLNKISDTMTRLNGSAIENPWNRKLRKTKLHLKYFNIIISMKYYSIIMRLDNRMKPSQHVGTEPDVGCQGC